MTSGAKVVLAMLGGTLAIALFVVAAFLLTDEGNLRCVANEDTLNPRDAEGRILPETRSYDNISDAEAFICHGVAYPRLEGWVLESAAATRSSDLGKVIEGEASAAVLLTYSRADAGASVEIDVSPSAIQRPDFEGDRESVLVGNAEATLIRSPEPGYPRIRRVLWKANGLDFMATAFLTDDFTESELLALLESVR
jgi:hypothetical protein